MQKDPRWAGLSVLRLVGRGRLSLIHKMLILKYLLLYFDTWHTRCGLLPRHRQEKSPMKNARRAIVSNDPINVRGAGMGRIRTSAKAICLIHIPTTARVRSATGAENNPRTNVITPATPGALIQNGWQDRRTRHFQPCPQATPLSPHQSLPHPRWPSGVLKQFRPE